MKKLFDVPDSYKEHITKFDSSDGFLALGIIVTYFGDRFKFCVNVKN